MADNIGISIVIPVFNNEKFLPDAVRSITEQKIEGIEIIIVDDGSTDQTPAIAEKLSFENKNIRVIHQENRWIYGSMNRGVKEARGEYVYILNSDDILYPGTLQMMMNRICKYNPDVVWTRIDEYRYGNDGQVKFINCDEKLETDIYTDKIEQIRKLWPTLYFSHIAVNQANLYRRKIMLRFPFRENIYGADVIFNIEIANEIRSMCVMKDAVYRFYNYDSEKANASIGKFYTYEHDMFNEFYTGYCKLFSDWNLPEESYKEKLADIRIRQVTRETRSLGYHNCKFSQKEKVSWMLSGIADDIVMNCANKYGRGWEVESRILSGLREVFLHEEIMDEGLKDLVDQLISLRFYDRDKGEIKKISEWKSAVYHDLNVCHIGKYFYERVLQ